jgi:hypothetical protein
MDVNNETDEVFRESLTSTPSPKPADSRNQRLIGIGLIVGGLILVGLLVAGVIYLINPATPTTRIRDILIIFMALEFLIVGAALIVLIVQLATLINLLQNEVKPILESATEASNTLRGTAVFLSDNLAEPVIKLQGYVAAMQRMMGFIRLIR